MAQRGGHGGVLKVIVRILVKAVSVIEDQMGQDRTNIVPAAAKDGVE